MAEAVNGTTTIRAFSKQTSLSDSFANVFDESQKNYVLGDAVKRWLNMRLQIYAVIIYVPAIAMNIYFAKSGIGLFAILMRYLTSMLKDINESVKVYNELEALTVNYNRCTSFEQIPAEAGYKHLDKIENQYCSGNQIEEVASSDNWPQSGVIQVKNLSISYRPDLPPVIKKADIEIQSGQKIAIVGRTGSGKSTILGAIFGNFDHYDGSIKLDGKEKKEVDLKLWRASITYIPQDPNLLAGTLRYNIDTANIYNDEQIIAILQNFELWNRFSSKLGLSTVIEAEGGNLSLGEKQLICLIRAILQNKKVILMDESTSSMDFSCEKQVQQLIQQYLSKSTIITVAHRIETINYCEMVAVVEDGKVAEYGRINELKSNRQSKFAQLISLDTLLKKNLNE